jgi:transmembrane sensor
MQTPDTFSALDDPEDLVSQATLWVVRMTSGETTAEERLAFQRWRDESPANAAALADARRLWLAMGPALRPTEEQTLERLRRRRPARFAAIAASVAACLVFGGRYVASVSHDYVTAAGERRAVSLADGTQVFMNGDSALDVSFNDGTRKVTLARGEVYFDVVHDATRPFTVTAGDGLVRDIGTAFSVRREGNGAAVVVARGEVEVDPAGPGRPPSLLTADQATVYGDSTPTVVHTVDASKDLSWVRGQLILENQSLADSVQAINRFYGGRLLLINRSAGERRINAVVDLNRIDDWLSALDKTDAVKVTRLGSLALLY